MRTTSILAVAAALSLTACSGNDTDDEMEMVLAMDEVPAVVRTAAEGAVPGIVLTEAELETEDGRQLYEMTGMKDGVEYEIDVTPTGEVIEVERDD